MTKTKITRTTKHRIQYEVEDIRAIFQMHVERVFNCEERISLSFQQDESPDRKLTGITVAWEEHEEEEE